jgi:acyl transferase domain-containing protein
MENSNSFNSEDIAIIGISARVADADTYEELWANLCAGMESVHVFSKEELREFGVPEAKMNHPRYVGAKAHLNNIDCFDAPFFNMSAGEAKKLDPQHRFFLECAWETLEDAGYANLDKSQDIGVIAGFGSVFSSYLMTYRSAHPKVEGTTISADLFSLDRDYGPTRVAYKLNLSGPSYDVQCACSTSLVAVHLACHSILDGSCHMALAGGCAVTPESYLGYEYESGDCFIKKVVPGYR